jgi:sugar-specific transcriptional regulator TrmB
MKEDSQVTELDIIKKAGLTESQAKGYLALIEHGALTPTKIATLAGENRTNGYMIAERLVSLGLAMKNSAGKTTYSALHPGSLEVLAERRRRVVQKNEQFIKQNINGLINLFYQSSEWPGSRTIEGVEGIKEAYRDTLRTGKDVLVLRSMADLYFEVEFWRKHHDRLAKAGIKTHFITHIPVVGANPSISATMMPEDAYTAPVEILVYGDKTALVAFGETAMATIISSPAIAESMRQILTILDQHFRQTYPQPESLAKRSSRL